MSSTFQLALRRMGSYRTVDLSEEKFRSVVIAQNALSNALALEQKYAILTENYISLKNTCSDQCRRWSLRNFQTYEDGSDMHLAISIAILNYLSTGRMYIDQTLQDIEKCEYEKDNASSNVAKLRSNFYDKYREFAFIEAFRNHCQHASIPKLKLDFNAKIVKDDIHNRLIVTINKDPLYQNKKLKKKGVDPMPKIINLLESIDIHYACLQVTQYEIRKQIGSTISEAETEVKGAHSLFAGQHSGSTAGLRARVKKVGKPMRSIPLSTEWNEVRVKLQSKYGAESVERVNVISLS